MSRHSQSVDTAVLARIQDGGDGSVFSVPDFLDLGTRNAVALALTRQKRAGILRSVGRGLYELPQHHARLGLLEPSTDQVIQALQRRDAIRLQPSGAYAANLLGLSEQMPMKLVFLTDGPQRRFHLGKREILLKRTTPRHMATAGRISGTVIQGLRWLGKEHVTDSTVASLRHRLTASEKDQLLPDLHHAPVWIAEIMRAIAQRTARTASP